MKNLHRALIAMTELRRKLRSRVDIHSSGLSCGSFDQLRLRIAGERLLLPPTKIIHRRTIYLDTFVVV
jgi:hypothetical protein